MNGENHMQDNFVEIPNQKPENESTSSRETNRSSSKEESEIILADQITPDKTIVKEIEQITEKTDIQENDEIILDETDVNEKEQITEISDIQENDNDTSADGQETKEIYGLDIHEEVSQKKKIIKRHSYGKVDNIEYKLESRLSGHVARNISGDFKAFNVETDVLFMPQLDLEYTDEEEEEEEKEEQEEDKLLIDYKTDDDIEVMMEKIANQQRERYSLRNKLEYLQKQNIIYKIRNILLQRQIALYMRKKRQYTLFKGTIPDSLDSIRKYEKNIYEYGIILEKYEKEKKELTAELGKLYNLRNKKQLRVERLFRFFQNSEYHLTRGMIYRETMGTIDSKLVMELLNKQKLNWITLNQLRLKYVNIKNLCDNKKEDLINFNEIDSQHNLIFYEKLKTQNLIYRQRVEEKDDQIEFLKRSAQKISRIVNHIREKSTALYTDILDLKEEIPIQESKFLDLQNKLAVVRKQRDAMRGLITNFKIESGLLTERKLLVDMELSQNEYKVFSKQLNDLKSDYNSTISKLRNARKTLEFMLGEKQKIQKSNISKRNSITNFNKKVTTKSSTYKISLPKGVFDLKPLVTHL